MKARPPVVIRLVPTSTSTLRSALDVFARAAGHGDFGRLTKAHPITATVKVAV